MQRKTIPETAGFNTNPWANFGIVKNQGFDASLEVNKSFGKDFFYHYEVISLSVVMKL